MNAAFLNLTIVTKPNHQNLVCTELIELKNYFNYFNLQILAMTVSD